MTRFALKLPLLVCVLFASAPLASEIHKWVDAEGNVHFGDRPPADAETTAVDVRPNVYSSPSIEALADVFSDRGAEIGKRGRVVLYSTTWCGYCRKARDYFRQQDIPFDEYDVENSPRGKQDYARMGAQGVPVILVGRQRLNGFSPAAFERIYRPATRS